MFIFAYRFLTEVFCHMSSNKQWTIALGPQTLTKFDNSLRFMCDQVAYTWSIVIRIVTAAVVRTTTDQIDLARSTHLFCTRYENNNGPCLLASPCGRRVFSVITDQVVLAHCSLVGRLKS